MYKVAILASILALAIPLIASSYATTIDVSIHTGSSDPNQHLTFYPPSSTAHSGDTLQIGNSDTVPHDIISGTPNSPDGKFDSGVIGPGKYFAYQIKSSDIGTLSYYDKNYPWMIGTVTVQSTSADWKIKHDVGSDVGNGTKVFDVQYQSVKDIISSAIKTKDKSVTFTLVGKATTNSTLSLKLPKGLITGPFIGVWLDNEPIIGYTVTDEGIDNLVSIPITPMTEQVSIVGTTIVPEFGPVAIVILVISIIAIITITRFRSIPRF